MTKPLPQSQRKTTTKGSSATGTKSASTTKGSDLKKGQAGVKNPGMHSKGFNKSSK